VCVWVCVCVCVCVYVCVCVWVWVGVFVFVCTHVLIHTFMHVYRNWDHIGHKQIHLKFMYWYNKTSAS